MIISLSFIKDRPQGLDKDAIFFNEKLSAETLFIKKINRIKILIKFRIH